MLMTRSTFYIIAAGMFAFLLAWLGNPIFIPDSYEQVIVAECWQSGQSTRMDCSNVFPWFRPPLPSLLIVPWLQWLDGFSVILLLSWLSSVCCVGILLHRIHTFFAVESFNCILPILLLGMVGLAGFVEDLGLLADSKIIALPFVFGAFSLLLSKEPTSLHAFNMGILLGLAFLTRFENLLLIVLGVPLILYYFK
jgi:hypothetical protein